MTFSAVDIHELLMGEHTTLLLLSTRPPSRNKWSLIHEAA